MTKNGKLKSQISEQSGGGSENKLRTNKRIAFRIVFGIIFLLVLPAILTLRTIKHPGSIEIISNNPTPLGYTWSLSLFIFPMLGIAWWFLREPKYNIQKKTFYLALLILVPLGFVLDILFGHFFFTFPNKQATIGIDIPAIGGPLPIEEFIFYITGFIFVLLTYLWSCEYWLEKYNVPEDEYNAYKEGGDKKIIEFNLWAVILGAVLLIIAIVYKKFYSSYPEGFPGYFTYLVVASIIPTSALLSSTRRFINWRAFSFTFFVITLISLLWEATLAAPYGWWGYNHKQMMGLFIGAWSGLPIEAVCVWIMVTFTTVILYETIKIWQKCGKRAREAFLGDNSALNKMKKKWRDPCKGDTVGTLANKNEEVKTRESRRLKLVIFTLVFCMVGDLIASWQKLGWKAAVFITFIALTIIIFYIVRENDKLFGRLFFLGAIVGLFTIPGDYFAVEVHKTLIYAPETPFIWKTPFYLPFGWIIVIVQMGYIAIRITDRCGLAIATFLIALLGGLYIPAYEYLAKNAGFWYYQNCRMIFNNTTPIYIINAEVLITLGLPLIIQQVRKVQIQWVMVLGILYGIWMLMSSIISFKLFGNPIVSLIVPK